MNIGDTTEEKEGITEGNSFFQNIFPPDSIFADRLEF